jgi:hypothetical protein
MLKQGNTGDEDIENPFNSRYLINFFVSLLRDLKICVLSRSTLTTNIASSRLWFLYSLPLKRVIFPIHVHKASDLFPKPLKNHKDCDLNAKSYARRRLP